MVSMDWYKEIFYTEMQKTDTGNLRKRSRLYQAQLDVSLLEPGTANFNLLNDSCFILIAPFDIFGKGLFRYTFEGTCRECPELKLNDGAVRVFINTKGNNSEEFSQEFLDLMAYITASTDRIAEASDSMRLKVIHKNVKKIKASEKMGVKFMQKWEELVYAREDGRAEGKAEGKAEGIVEGEALKLIRQVCKKLIRGEGAETIADELEEEKAGVEQICRIAEKYAPEYDCGKIYQELKMEN